MITNTDTDTKTLQEKYGSKAGRSPATILTYALKCGQRGMENYRFENDVTSYDTYRRSNIPAGRSQTDSVRFIKLNREIAALARLGVNRFSKSRLDVEFASYRDADAGVLRHCAWAHLQLRNATVPDWKREPRALVAEFMVPIIMAVCWGRMSDGSTGVEALNLTGGISLPRWQMMPADEKASCAMAPYLVRAAEAYEAGTAVANDAAPVTWLQPTPFMLRTANARYFNSRSDGSMDYFSGAVPARVVDAADTSANTWDE